MADFYDVVVIGGGISGGCVLRELSKYDLKVAIVEKENDVADATTKANSAIVHAGYDPKPGTKMAYHNVRGCAMMKDLCSDLSVHYKNCGSLVIAFSEEELQELQKLEERGKKNGVPGLKILSHDEVMEMEPNLNPEVKYALFAPSAGIINPWELCIAVIENAVDNGAEFFLSNQVTSIDKIDGGYQVNTNQGLKIKTKYIVNAAGVYGDVIHNMIAPSDFEITAAKGEYYLLDKSQGTLVDHTIFQCPTKAGKGVLLSPTVHGNLIVGPDRTDNCNKEDVSTTREGLSFVLETIGKSCKKIDFRQSIRNFAGLRAISNRDDFIIRELKEAPGVVEAVGIQSPGLTSAPSIALEVLELLENAGLVLKPKATFNGKRHVIHFKELSMQEKQKLIQQNPLYGRIICRCESITEGEIVDALKSPLTPPSLDAVKRRCNAGMGRCQGGFCGPRVLDIIMREKGVAPTEVLQDKEGTYILTSDTLSKSSH